MRTTKVAVTTALLLLMLSVCTPCHMGFAEPSESTTNSSTRSLSSRLSALENVVFGAAKPDASMISRVDDLENNVVGHTNAGSITDRLQQLEQLLGKTLLTPVSSKVVQTGKTKKQETKPAASTKGNSEIQSKEKAVSKPEKAKPKKPQRIARPTTEQPKIETQTTDSDNKSEDIVTPNSFNASPESTEQQTGKSNATFSLQAEQDESLKRIQREDTASSQPQSNTANNSPIDLDAFKPPSNVQAGEVSSGGGLRAGINLSDLNAQKTSFPNAPTDPKAWLQATHPEFNLAAQKSPQILEVEGGADTTAPLLDRMGVLYQKISIYQLSLLSSQTKVLVVDCCGMPGAGAPIPFWNLYQAMGATSPIHNQDWPLIRQWVSNGGFLLATDWSLDNLITPLFPDTICWTRESMGQVRYLPSVVTGRDPALLSGTQGLHTGWSTAGCMSVRILRPDLVQVLVQADYKIPVGLPTIPTMPFMSFPLRQWRAYKPVLACEFTYGRGHVLYLAGHFLNTNSTASGSAALRWAVEQFESGNMKMEFKQALFCNFIIAGLESS